MLRQAAPATLASANDSGETLVHLAAACHRLPATDVLRRLLHCSPDSAFVASESGELPIHAARWGCPKNTAVLLEAAPETALAEAGDGATPVSW